MERHRLAGSMGNGGNVFRDGNEVLRPRRPHAATVCRWLTTLTDHGFAAPRPLGTTPDGAERFAWIDGDVGVPPFPAWVMTDDALAQSLSRLGVCVWGGSVPSRPLTGAGTGTSCAGEVPGDGPAKGLGRIQACTPIGTGSQPAGLLRRYHETAADLGVPDVGRTVGGVRQTAWSSELADPAGGPIICHNDVCPENVLYRDGHAVALLDFDFAAPGRPLWDLAHLARMWAPLRPADIRVAGMAALSGNA